MITDKQFHAIVGVPVSEPWPKKLHFRLTMEDRQFMRELGDRLRDLGYVLMTNQRDPDGSTTFHLRRAANATPLDVGDLMRRTLKQFEVEAGSEQPRGLLQPQTLELINDIKTYLG